MYCVPPWLRIVDVSFLPISAEQWHSLSTPTTQPPSGILLRLIGLVIMLQALVLLVLLLLYVPRTALPLATIDMKRMAITPHIGKLLDLFTTASTQLISIFRASRHKLGRVLRTYEFLGSFEARIEVSSFVSYRW